MGSVGGGEMLAAGRRTLTRGRPRLRLSPKVGRQPFNDDRNRDSNVLQVVPIRRRDGGTGAGRDRRRVVWVRACQQVF